MLLMCFYLVLLGFPGFSYFLLYFPIFPYVPSECTVEPKSPRKKLKNIQVVLTRARNSLPGVWRSLIRVAFHIEAVAEN